jgi:hypothetical protein
MVTNLSTSRLIREVLTAAVVASAFVVTQSDAAPIGACVIAFGDSGGGNTASISYGTAPGLGSCTAGVTSTVTGAGQTSQGATFPNPNPVSVTAAGSSELVTGFGRATASLGTGTINVDALAVPQGAFPGVQGTGTGILFDTITFLLPGNMATAQVTLNAFLNGSSSSSTGGSGSNYGLSEVLDYGLGGFSWSASTAGFGPNPGFTGTFSNHSASGFNWQDTFQVVNGQTINVTFQAQANAFTQWSASVGTSVGLVVPDGVSFTSGSGQFLTNVPVPTASLLLGSAFAWLFTLRRRSL